MMWEEFEKLAGYEVSYKDYTEIIEPMYTALPNVSKQDFVTMIDKKRFALPTKTAMVKKMKKIAGFLFENCGVASFYEQERELEKIIHEYAERFWSLNWTNDISAYCYTLKRYAYRGSLMDRGCSFPYELVIGKGDKEYERITLVKID